MALIPIAMAFGLTTLFGSGMIFAAGVFYGLMALGRKWVFWNIDIFEQYIK